MESSSSSLPLALSLTTLLVVSYLLPLSSATVPKNPLLTYHNGPLLTGNVSLAVLWYGKFDPIEKTVVRTFIESLSTDRSLSFQPDVYAWWQKVESYVKVAKKESGAPGVFVRIAREVDDEDASVGKVVSGESLPRLLEKATAGLGNTVAVIFGAKDVEVEDTCTGISCYLHGVLGKQLYIVVGNPEKKCSGSCAVPFHNSNIHGMPLVAITLQPPSGNMGADAMVIQFARALAETVTNPFNTGFYGDGEKGQELHQAARLCRDLFASGALPGYPGNVRLDAVTGGAFNAHGLNSSKFLLPALWDIDTAYCWTVL